MPNRTHKTISQDLRETIIRLVVNQGISQRKVAITLTLSRNTVQSIVHKYNRTNSAEPGVRGGSRRTVLNEQIRQQINILVDDNRTTTVNEIKDALNVEVHLSIVWRWLKEMGYTYKMISPVFERRNDEDIKSIRMDYVRWYSSQAPILRYRNLIFIDESPFSLCMFKSHSWVRRGVTLNPTIRPRGRNETMILALNGQNIIHCEAVTVGVNGTLFQEFINSCCRTLGTVEQFTLIVDNVRFHHTINIENYPNISIKYLPA